MAKFSMKQGGKEVGSADVYAAPHTMSGKNLDAKEGVVKKGNSVDAIKMSVGSQVFKSQMDEVKTSGIEMRGAGAATKGRMCRGPMA
jgi:hypothetical protein